MKKKPLQKNTSKIDFNSSIKNILLNSIIFFLIAVIVYMGFSIFMKLKDGDQDIPVQKVKSHAAKIIQVEILNGCGEPGVADRFRDYLRQDGFDVVNVGNYVEFTVDETMVIDRIGNLDNAKKVAEDIGINPKKAFPQLNSDYFVDVTVVIGRDYAKLLPLKNKG